MSSLWITYAWEDNKTGDVDFVAQELKDAGLEVKLDRWNINAGGRLWEQIADFISNEDKSDGWLLIATENSLDSEACKEEFSYALQRALETRGFDFPVLSLFLSEIDNSLIPPAIKTRLFVSIADQDWKERIVAATERRQHNPTIEAVEPYFLKLYTNQEGKNSNVIEVRPRAGVWSPFLVAIPISEKDSVAPYITHGPSNIPTNFGFLFHPREDHSTDNKWWAMEASNQATPTQSYYIWCKELPTELRFGVSNPPPQYYVQLNKDFFK